MPEIIEEMVTPPEFRILMTLFVALPRTTPIVLFPEPVVFESVKRLVLLLLIMVLAVPFTVRPARVSVLSAAAAAVPLLPMVRAELLADVNSIAPMVKFPVVPILMPEVVRVLMLPN